MVSAVKPFIEDSSCSWNSVQTSEQADLSVESLVWQELCLCFSLSEGQRSDPLQGSQAIFRARLEWCFLEEICGLFHRELSGPVGVGRSLIGPRFCVLHWDGFQVGYDGGEAGRPFL